MQHILNKWQYLFYWGTDPMRGLDSRQFHFGIFKLISFPNEGEMIEKTNYKGFWIKKNWRPFTIEISSK